MSIVPIHIEPSLPPDNDDHDLGGLLALVDGGETPLPLERVTVRTTVSGGFARTVVDQVFANPLDEPMEAIHLFPLPHDGAVTEVELRCGELVVRAHCRERGEAQATFDAAREAGHRAALLTQERADVHTLRVTNLPAGESVTVRVVVVERLAISDGQFQWRFPTTIAPRYLPGSPVGHSGVGTLPDTDQVPDASRLQPPLRLEGGTELDLEVAIEGPVQNLECSQHAVKLSLDEVVRIAPSGIATLNKDFVLSFAVGLPDQMGAQAWTDGEYTLAVINPPTGAVAPSMPRDAVFVVDISGSMGGQKMTAAKQALSAALHGLLPGDRFQVIAFDDRLERFSKDFVAYDDRSLTKADRWIHRLVARGGTEMLPAINAALQGKTPVGRLRTVLFITDGQAWNEAELMAVVAKRSERTRFFSFGIDTAVNSALLERLARVGGGTCELAAPTDDIEEKVARLEARFGSPIATELRIEGAEVASPLAGTVFAGRPAILVMRGGASKLEVSGVVGGGSFETSLVPEPAVMPLGVLWARERIAHLQDRILMEPSLEEELKAQVIGISTEFAVISQYTAFVAVEATRTVDGTLREVVQPHELPESWSAPEIDFGAPAPSTAFWSPGAMRAALPPSPAPQMTRSLSTGAPAPMRAAPSRRSPAKKSKRSLLGGLMDFFGGPTDDMAEPEEEEAVAPVGAGAWDAEPEPAPAAPVDVAARLARLQGASGDFGGSIERTAAALLALVLLGSTRRRGTRRRVVLKAATWLVAHRGNEAADLALSVLEAAEAGTAPVVSDDWRALTDAGEEGAALAELL